ncbi:MAG: hypothetical protein HQL60_03000 [Magnetococcales bacterium]|nr:hypothetical protein [Magnetococcales bacterium]
MQHFNEPHQRIHRIAVDAQQLIHANKNQDAHRLVQTEEQDVLMGLLALFDGIEEIVHRYLLEYAIVFETREEIFAVAVDDINLFCRINEIQYPMPDGVVSGSTSLVQAVGRYQPEVSQQERDVLLLDMRQLLEQSL